MGRYIFLILLFTSIALAQETGKKVIGFDSTRNSFEDLKMAVVEAGKANKRILLDVGGEWCIWCHRLHEFIDEHKEIKEFVTKHYVVVKVNYSKKSPNAEFLSQYPKIPGYPHFFVLSKKGRLLHSQDTGKLEKEKSYDAEKLMAFFKKWAR